MAITDPTAFFTFNASDATDDVGSADGTDTSITYSSGNAKLGANGAGFTATASVISFPTTLGIGSTLTASYSLWLKISNGDTNRMSPFSWGETGGTGIQLEIYNGGLSYYEASNGSKGYDSSNLVNDGNWHHVVLTYASGALTGYLDGSSIWTGAGSLSLAAGNAHLLGHRIYNDTTGAYTGSIDAFGVWGSYTLTSTEVTELYNSGTGVEYPFSGGGGATYRRKALLGVGQ